MKKETIIIQGDTFRTSIVIDDIPFELIHNIIFVCNSLSLQKDLIYSEESQEWVLSFSSEETESFKAGLYSFDISIIFTDNQVLTIPDFYKARLRVLYKENKINYEYHG